ncbi:MAG: alkyl sulfatase dimerization domain-containing protein [Pseudomonadota bacterium]
MADLLRLSADIIDGNSTTEAGDTLVVNRVTGELSEIDDNTAFIESFCHVPVFKTSDGLVVVDTSSDVMAPKVLKSLRNWTDAPIHSVVLTHGQIDHVGGAATLVDDALQRGHRRPTFYAHQNLLNRYERYKLTNGFNYHINQRQFSQSKLKLKSKTPTFGPSTWIYPDVTYQDRTTLTVGGEAFELRHFRGETDDHTFIWLPGRKTIATGDFLIWAFPNCGNPQKVQRYPREWALALRHMISLEPELLLPGHGLPVAGRDRIRTMLDNMASALELLVEQTVALMNEGASLDTIVNQVRVPQEYLDLPYMRPTYDEPEFVIRNIWRLYGGWWDGNAATLKPAPQADMARAVAELAGGAEALARSAEERTHHGDLRVACELVEMAALAKPDSKDVQAARARVYLKRRKSESSLMAQGIYGSEARASAERAGIEL